MLFSSYLQDVEGRALESINGDWSKSNQAASLVDILVLSGWAARSSALAAVAEKVGKTNDSRAR
jgi:hypothetical protein